MTTKKKAPAKTTDQVQLQSSGRRYDYTDFGKFDPYNHAGPTPRYTLNVAGETIVATIADKSNQTPNLTDVNQVKLAIQQRMAYFTAELERMASFYHRVKHTKRIVCTGGTTPAGK